MSFETDIRDAFEHHAEDVQPTAKAFSAVEAGVRRYHRRRVVSMSALGVTLLIAGAVVAPQLVADDEPGFAGGGGGSSEVSEATLRPQRRYFQLRYPADWQIDYDGAWYDLVPSELVGLLHSDPFSFSIIHQDDLITDLIPDGVALEPGYTLGGQPAKRGEAIIDGVRVLVVAADWSGPCGCEVANLLIVIRSASDEAWLAFGDDALAMVDSVEPATTFPVAPVHSALGTVEFGVTYDAVTEALTGYLDSRLFGGGYDYWLTQGAIDQYRAQDAQISNVEGASWMTFSVRSREELADGTVRFTIAMVHNTGRTLIRPGAAYPGETIEHLVVGPGAPAEADVPRDHVVVGVSFDG